MDGGLSQKVLENADNIDIFSLSWNSSSFSIVLEVGPAAFLVVVLLTLYVILKIFPHVPRGGEMSIDQAEIGVGGNKILLRPNLTDRQVAYAIWVELSTRKIGLPIDLEDDVIVEIYDSWYNYFSVTRELIKTVSVTKIRGKSTQTIVQLSIDVLNNGLRPHLTKWQARYRHWYDRRIDDIDKKTGVDQIIDPQSIQKSFPRYEDLERELLAVNKQLMAYRSSMQVIVFGLP